MIQKLLESVQIPQDVKKRVEYWLSSNIDDKTRSSIERMIQEDPKALVDSFYTNLAFGTGGMRGIMGPGTNRMNEYTVRSATQGLANYLLKTFPPETELRVAIGYDSRNNSRLFADEAAKVLAGNNIHVFLYDSLMPTPLVSFACRYLKCHSAIMVTASHNPPAYNGYKVYWSDGGQVLPPHDKGIVKEVELIQDFSQVKIGHFHSPLIKQIGKEVCDAYLKGIDPLQLYPASSRHNGEDLKIIYSSLHGTGIVMVPEALERYGFDQIGLVTKQIVIDGNFPTTHRPNPEEKEALELGMKQLLDEKADIFIATDPDCDRMGVVVRTQDDKTVILNGNQLASLLCYAICKAYKEQNRFPEKAAFVKSIVTSDLMAEVVKDYKASLFEILPGFKYVAEKIHLWETGQNGAYSFIFGAEESYGTLLGTLVRDKDAVLASCLISEIACKAKKEGKTLLDLLDELYNKYGYFHEDLVNLEFEESREGKEAQAKLMNTLRSNPPSSFANLPVKRLGDCKTGFIQDLTTKAQEKLSLPTSDVLIFELEGGSKVIIRPSGTEPKVKIYLMIREKNTPQGRASAQKICSLLEQEIRSKITHKY